MSRERASFPHTIDILSTRARRTAYRIDKLRNAAVGVASGPTGLTKEQGHVGEYIAACTERFDRTLPDAYNPSDEVIDTSMLALVDSTVASGARDWLRLPWGSQQRVQLDRLAGTIISFVDDHSNKIPREFFPVDKMLEYLFTVRENYLRAGRRLTIPDQYAVALDIADDNPVAAAVLAHSSYRSVARGWDTRVDERLRFPVISEDPRMLDMVKVAESTAMFSSTSKADPLGDTYHFWGQYSAGLVSELNKSDHPAQATFLKTAFYYGPNMMSFVRETILKKTQAAGNHLEVDRHALRLGTIVGRRLQESQVYNEN